MSNFKKITLGHVKHVPEKIQIDKKKPVVLIDSSYMIFYRFHATKLWYSKAIGNKHENELLKCDIFMKKHNDIFFNGLNKLCKKYKVPNSNIIFAYDCPYENIWRHDRERDTDGNDDENLVLSYKRGRRKKYKNSDFDYKKLFDNGKNNLIKKYCEDNNCPIVYHSNGEADDIIAILNNEIKKHIDSNIIIAASDTDYLQLCDDKTLLYKLTGDRICNAEKYMEKYSISVSNGSVVSKKFDKERYLISKLLMGDKSDSISPCYFDREILIKHNINLDGSREYIKCTESVVNKIIDNSRLYEELLKKLKQNRVNGYSESRKEMNKNDFTNNNQFTKNQYMIDMYFIPEEIIKNITIMKPEIK